MDDIKALIKQLESYFKKNWEFEDYPTKTWENPNATEDNIAFGAGIINWSMMVSHGASREEALKELEQHFNEYRKNNDDLCRPGVHVPLKFASSKEIDKYEKTAVHYFKSFLKMDYYDGFYSDFTILSFLRGEETDEDTMKTVIISRTKENYQVDISDIYDEPIWKIFERIDTKGNASRQHQPSK